MNNVQESAYGRSVWRCTNSDNNLEYLSILKGRLTNLIGVVVTL